MKLRYLRAIQLVLGLLILGAPVLKTISRTGLSVSIWFYILEAVCIGLFYLCHRLNRCLHCKKQLGYGQLDKCPQCGEPLDV